MTGNLFPARLRASHQDRRQNPHHRRNGRLQACEPCRKGKLRCDHMMPTCGRCAKRTKPEQCVYHPAPLTKMPSPHATIANADNPRMNSFGALHQSPPDHAASREGKQKRHNTILGYNSFSSKSNPSVHLNCSIGIGDTLNLLPSRGIRDDIGLISHSAVLAEHELSIGIQPPNVDAMPTTNVSRLQIDRGANVLVLLKNISAIEKYIDKWFSFAAGVVVIEPMVRMWLDGLRSTWHKSLSSQKPEDLQMMSEKIWENTQRPIAPILNGQTTARQFCDSVTGAFLRWEVVGIVVTLVSLVAQSLKDGDPIFCSHNDVPTNRAVLALKMHNASEMCVQFCDDFQILNDLYLWLLYENSIAYCSMRSKGKYRGYENFRKKASLTNALLSSNLHQSIEVDERTPFFVAELRKRLFLCAYENDKYTASFSGRPPNLTKQYCLLQVPLDLTDIQLMSEGQELEHAVSDLNEEGWNQQGAIRSSTFARLAATNALITEDILEVSLGNLSHEEVSRRAAEIALRTNTCWNELPDFLRIDFDGPWRSQHSPIEVLYLVLIRLNHLDHHFMLERTLSKKTNTELANVNTKLLSVCQDIFQFVVVVVDNRDFFRDFQVDIVQILAKHGIPTAAVLAMELLHQEQYPASASATTCPLHRSDTIQSLSVFVACLGAVTPDASGYHSCARGKKFLKKVLDMILGPGVSTADTLQHAEFQDDPMIGAPLLQPRNEGDVVRWIEEMEWDQDNWLNFN